MRVDAEQRQHLCGRHAPEPQPRDGHTIRIGSCSPILVDYSRGSSMPERGAAANQGRRPQNRPQTRRSAGLAIMGAENAARPETPGAAGDTPDHLPGRDPRPKLVHRRRDTPGCELGPQSVRRSGERRERAVVHRNDVRDAQQPDGQRG
jgi:hypothetical protein